MNSDPHMGVETIVCGWDRTHPLLKTNDIGPTHFYRLQFSEYVCALFRAPSRQSNPFHMTNALID